MKKTLSLLAVFVILLSLCACGNEPKSDTTNSIQETSTGIEETSNSITKPTQTTDTEETTVPIQESATTPSEESSTKPTEKPIEPNKPTERPIEPNKPTERPIEPNNPTETTKPVHTHSYSAATCTQAKKCSCGATSGSALGHKWTDATCTTPKICTVCKTIEGIVADHKWADATCQAPKTCSVCKKTEGVSVDHSFESNGKCKWCKQVVPVSISKLGNRRYTFTKLTKTDSEYGVVDAIFQYGISFEWASFGGPSRSLVGDCGICEGRDQEWLDSHRVTYGGKEYYTWGGGYGVSFSTQISNNHIVILCEDGSTIELELFSDDTLKVVSASMTEEFWREDITVGAIFE